VHDTFQAKNVFCGLKFALCGRVSVSSKPYDSYRFYRIWSMVAAAVLLLAVAASYSNAINAPFVFDDVPAIAENTSLAAPRLWLQPPSDTSLSGRPIANVTFGLNRIWSGDQVWSYHLVNIAIHAIAVLVLFGLVKRTLQLPRFRDSFGASALPMAFATALLWAVHPLQTESVTYVVQRVESLAGCFSLLTLYCFARSQESERRVGWLSLSVTCCALGMATKETAAVVPIVTILYDWIFVGRNFQEIWMQRKRYYAGLGVSWLLLAWLVIEAQGRAGTAGFHTGVSVWAYLCTQCAAIPHYLRLVLWPSPLIFDYGTRTISGLSEVWLEALGLFVALSATAWGIWRKHPIGFLGIWFFATLAPSSSFVPIASQTMAEHRMYLALAAPIAVFVLGLHRLARRPLLWWAGVFGCALVLSTVTYDRNLDYRDAGVLWRDTATKRPENPRAFDGLAFALVEDGRWQEAIAACDAAMRADPTYRGDLPMHRGRALLGLGRPAEARIPFEQMLQMQPNEPELHNYLGMALAAAGNWPEAVTRYETAIRLRPVFPDARNNLGNALAKSGRLTEATMQYAEALKERPDFADAEANWGRSLIEAKRFEDALPHFRAALRLRPGAEAHEELARALAEAGRPDDAVREYTAAVGAAPLAAGIRINFGSLLMKLGKLEWAKREFQEALRIDDDAAEAHYNLGNLFVREEKYQEAIAQYEAALRSAPDFLAAHHNLGTVLLRLDRAAEAVPHFEKTVALAPQSAEARHGLSLALGRAERWREAEEQELAALRLNPDFEEAQEHLSWLRKQR
jgi:tetratricopeptide (TPR) repeat protein